MAEYIEREAAFDAVFGQFCASSDETEAALNAAIEEIRAIPAADVREVVRASWGYPTPYTAQCTNCGTLYWDFRNIRDFKMNFCPNCGAWMEADHGGEN